MIWSNSQRYSYGREGHYRRRDSRSSREEVDLLGSSQVQKGSLHSIQLGST